MKVCSNPECKAAGAPQPLDAFHRDASGKDGLRASCKACEAKRKRRANMTPKQREAQREAGRRYEAKRTPEQREAEREYMRRRRAKRTPEEREADREANRRRKIRREYGLRLEQYDEIIRRGCAMCGSHENLHLDHDHATGKIREALCARHNHALGHFQDDPKQLREVLRYLAAHGRSSVPV